MKRGSFIALLLFGCTGPAVATDPSSSSTEGSTGSSDATTSPSSDATSASSSSSAGAETSSSSTGEVLDGPGCGVVPECTEGSIVGNVRVRSIDDVAALEGVQEILGTLEIANSDLKCLDALACLRIVGGDVRIQGNGALRSTAGLANVEEVGTLDVPHASGSVVLADNEVLERFEGFDGVRRIPKGATLWQNPALREVAAFAAVRRLEELSINDNPALESLSGLHDLERLGRCNVNRNPSLCISEVFEVCGDLEETPDGVTDNNDDGC